MNLMLNAIRFTDDGGNITFRTFHQTDTVFFSLSDTGIGIKETDLEVIFEKFYEVTDIMHHHSGTIEFNTQEKCACRGALQRLVIMVED